MPPSPLHPEPAQPWRQRFALAVIALMTLTASACGTGDDTSASTGQSSTGQTSTSTTAEDPATSATPDTSASSEPGASGELTATDEDGVTALDEDLLSSGLDGLSAGTLSDFDRDSLIFMREEEKLALDVYQALFDTWALPIFDKIAGAEQTHTDSVKTLLDRWEIPDPAVDQPAGVFANADLQALYDDLVARGNQSVVDALAVGATIEELDITDLQARASDDPAITLVYANLEKGSRNHLRAFIRQLDANGASYTPSYLTQDAFDAIVNSPTERGRGR